RVPVPGIGISVAAWVLRLTPLRAWTHKRSAPGRPRRPRLGDIGTAFGTALCITAITIGWLSPVGHISIKRRSDPPRYSRIPDRTLRPEFRLRPRPESCEAPSAASSTRSSPLRLMLRQCAIQIGTARQRCFRQRFCTSLVLTRHYVIPDRLPPRKWCPG